jgi:hypothetical protein
MKVVPIHKDENTQSPYMYVIGRGFDYKENCSKWLLRESSSENWRDWYHAKDFEPYIDIEDELYQEQEEQEEKVIVAQWIPEDTYGYGRAMRVIQSNHPRFSVGCRFDYGFTGIAGDEGYTVIIKPMEDKGE